MARLVEVLPEAVLSEVGALENGHHDIGPVRRQPAPDDLGLSFDEAGAVRGDILVGHPGHVVTALEQPGRPSAAAVGDAWLRV